MSAALPTRAGGYLGMPIDVELGVVERFLGAGLPLPALVTWYRTNQVHSLFPVANQQIRVHVALIDNVHVREHVTLR
jgi:hypothetical protein